MTRISSLPAPGTFSRLGIKYRRWMKAHKRRIVEETFVPGASVSIVARRHDVNANQVFTWRQQYMEGKLDVPAQAADGFMPVGVIGNDGMLTAVEGAVCAPPAVVQPVPSGSCDARAVITLSLRDGMQVRMEGDIGLPALQCVLKMALGQP